MIDRIIAKLRRRIKSRETECEMLQTKLSFKRGEVSGLKIALELIKDEREADDGSDPGQAG